MLGLDLIMARWSACHVIALAFAAISGAMFTVCWGGFND
jgi:hypothetical protein